MIRQCGVIKSYDLHKYIKFQVFLFKLNNFLLDQKICNNVKNQKSQLTMVDDAFLNLLETDGILAYCTIESILIKSVLWEWLGFVHFKYAIENL